MKRINTVIIEDEEQLKNALIDLFELFCPEIELIGTAGDVKTGIELINNTSPQLVFLDIKLPDGSGFDLLKAVPDNQHVVFTTAYDEYALRAIKANAIDYLLKPVDPDELVGVVKKARDVIGQDQPLDELKEMLSNLDQKKIPRKKITISTSDRVYLIDVHEIVRCESQDNYTTIHLFNGESVLASRTLKEFSALLEPLDFERIHRSHLINMNYLKTYVKSDGGYVVMKGGAKIPVAQRKKEYLIRKLKSHD